MNGKFINFLKKESLIYQESSKAFWDDEHISKYMLQAHLNTENDGASRKLATIKKSVEWICEYCLGGESKKLLDLGCGAGIYSELLHDKGFSVTGIDFSKRSIEYAKGHAEETNRNIQYYYKNYLEIDYDNQFDVVILIYCDFGVLSPKDRNTLLKKVYQALKVGGILILDAYYEPYLNSFHEMQSINYEKNGFWASEPYVLIQRNQYYKETANTLEQYLVVTDNDCECYNIWNQIYSQEELLDELSKVKFRNIKFFDDVQGMEFTGKNDTICSIVSK